MNHSYMNISTILSTVYESKPAVYFSSAKGKALTHRVRALSVLGTWR